MYLTAKQEIFAKLGKSSTDTVLLAGLHCSYRINHLTEHLSATKKFTAGVLVMLVGKRRRLLTI